MRNPAIDDLVKITLLSVLSHYGVEVSESAGSRFFKDIDAAYASVTAKLLEGVSLDENLISLLLEDFSSYPRQTQLSYIAGLEATRDERALPILSALAEYWDKEVAAAAIAAIGAIKSGKSLVVLENLFNHRETWWGVIQKAITNLGAQGITKQQWTEPCRPLRECLLTHVDGRGSRILIITREDDHQTYDAVFLMLNERVGIKDCHGSRHLSAHEYKRAVSTMKQEMTVARIDYEYALTLVRDSLFTAKKNQALISPEFSLRRRIFGNDDLTPKEHKPKFSDILLAEVRRKQARLLADSAELVFVPPFEDWWMDVPASYRFVQKNRLALRGSTFSEESLRRFIEEVIAPERSRLARRLAFTAELIEKTELRSPKRKLWMTLALWLAVEDQQIPLHEIPFLVELANMTIEYVLDNIEMGFQEPESFLPEHYR